MRGKPMGPVTEELPEERVSMGPMPEEPFLPEPEPPEPELPEEERERKRRALNTSPDDGNTANNPDNNITSRTLEGGAGISR